MLNHTYTSVKNANLVDCGTKQHISSQPFPLLKDNFLGEFRTELEKKKVLANLGIASELSLEWEYIKGDIGRSEALTKELDSRTKYVSQLDGFTKNITEGIQYLETIVGGEQEGEEEQNKRLTTLETASKELSDKLTELKTYLEQTIEIDINTLEESLEDITEKVNNITDLIQVSSKAGNALSLLTSEDVEEGEIPGLYVPDLSEDVNAATENIGKLQEEVKTINESLDDFVTKEELGGGDFDFVNDSDFTEYKTQTATTLQDIQTELSNTVKTGEDGHVDTLYVNTISKNNNEESIKITDSFEVTSGIPLDVRFVVNSLEELHSLKPLVCYAGMGVIVSNQASLYILREPVNGIIDEEYIADKDGVNWKCPEDLVIEVLTQEEYDAKVESDSINPNMFYYIHEEVTEEPIREQFDSDEAYTEALNKWLRVLQQKYMSAVWGQDIENLVASKAPATAIISLESEIQRLSTLLESLSGGSSEINLKDLNDQVQNHDNTLNTLTVEGGTIPTIQKEISDLQTSVTTEYVTKQEISVEDPNIEYIFVKKSVFENYTKAHEEAIATSVTTKSIIISENINIGSNIITTSEQSLLLNSERLALSKEVPIISVIDKDQYESLENPDENTYYYIYNDDERYLLDSEFTKYKTQQSEALNTLSNNITSNKNTIGVISNLTTENKNSLVFAVNEVNANLSQLITNIGDLTKLPEGITQIIESITDIYSKISELTTKVNTLENRISSLETGTSA